MILTPLRVPRRLRAVPELGPHEIHAGALTERHVGLVVAVAKQHNTITGRLKSVPTESMTKPLLVLWLGDVSVALHPAAVVMVIPDTYRATITVAPRPHEDTP